MHTLANKSALILGATSGIGLEVARNFVAAGARVAMTGRRETGAQTAARHGAEFLRCDVREEDQVRGCLEAAEARLGKLNILVINAGVAEDEGSLAELGSDQMRSIVETNLGGAFFALKYAPPHLADGGSVIYTGSVVGSGLTHGGAGAYAASKAGGAYLARTAALELAPREIRVNAICPALIADTGMMVPDDGNAQATLLAKLNAFGRMGRLEEVAGIYNFLASDAASFITGQEIRVDGGMSAGLGLPLFSALAQE